MKGDSSPWGWIGLSIAVVVCAVPLVNDDVGWMVGNRLGLWGSHRPQNERHPSANLKTIATAQFDFRANDRDGNGVAEFWHEDISGLYTLKGTGDYEIKLIEITVAAADARPVTDIGAYITQGPKSGYLFKTLRPPDEADWWPDGRFGAVCYPAEYGASGTYTCIIGEKAVLYRKDLGRGGGIDVYPADPKAEGWERVP